MILPNDTAYKLPVVVYDACVLYPFNLRNVLIQCAYEGLVQAHWSDDIHDEWIRNILERDTGVQRDRLERTRDLMDNAVPDAKVDGFHHLIPNLQLNDPDDRHVLALAIHCKADCIVSADRGFTNVVLAPHNLKVHRPSGFLSALYQSDPEAVISAVKGARLNLTKKPVPVVEFIERLRKCDVGGFCDLLEKHVDEDWETPGA
jgi:predicted nucleic acid-binding protein